LASERRAGLVYDLLVRMDGHPSLAALLTYLIFIPS
jgi:hypothetical protein